MLCLFSSSCLGGSTTEASSASLLLRPSGGATTGAGSAALLIVSPPSSGLREEAKEGSSKPPHPPVSRGQIRENIIAVLTLTSTCQRMPTYHDQHNSGRLPGNMVIVHEECCAIELKILMHHSGHSVRIYQNALEIPDGTNLKNLDKDIVLRVLEEPFPTRTSPSSPMVRYTISQSIIGNMMVQDPTIPCSSSNDGPHLLSFVVSEEQHSAILLNLYGDPLVLLGSRGAAIGEVRDLLRFGPKAAIVGVCGCGRHDKTVRAGAFVPFGSTLLQWSNLQR